MLIVDANHMVKKYKDVNALDDFNLYLASKIDFSERGIDLGGDEIYQKTIVNISAIIHAVPLIHPPLSDFIESIKKHWGIIWEEEIHPIVRRFEEEIKSLNDKGVLHSIRGKKDLDEAPSAYKDITKVMKNQEDLVEVKIILEPLAVIKG